MDCLAGGNRFFSVGILSLLLLANSLAVRASDDSPKILLRENKPVLVLPESLTQYIKAKYPNLRVPNVEDMTADWATYLKKDTVPYACWGDFNGDGMTDVALILIGKQRWRLLAFNQTDEHTYEALRLGHFPGPDRSFTRHHPLQNFYIYTLEAGKKLKVGEELVGHTQHEFDSIAFFRLGEPADGILYRWRTKNNLYGVTRFGGLTD